MRNIFPLLAQLFPNQYIRLNKKKLQIQAKNSGPHAGKSKLAMQKQSAFGSIASMQSKSGSTGRYSYKDATMTVVKISLFILQVMGILAHSPSHSFQSLFLDRINPSYGNTIFGGSIIDNSFFSTTPQKIPFTSSGTTGQGSASQIPQTDFTNGFFPSSSSSSSSSSGGSNNFGQIFPNIPPPQPTQDPEAAMGCGQTPNFCPKSRYRSYDGSCNNLQNPGVGTPQTRYNRLLPQKYGDGISTPTLAKSGNDLPSARTVSINIYPDIPIEDPIWNLNAMQYGQIITHDMSMIVGSTQTQPHATRCCSPNGQLLELANSPEHCFPIVIPVDDPAYSQQNVRCMNFVRTITDRDRNCISRNQPAEQVI
ncbi:hypothetical protein GWI33_013942 [Rhynchophorus ferrugineus]|uniref:Peroxidase n=1 Tax=Rhynchophorus ferrugineus TaxID=354439 RepID=A0A834I8E4_RHYFE|nr:hypothetical protein GWI33_013942 [Rhynchophorus ferrugineus]